MVSMVGSWSVPSFAGSDDSDGNNNNDLGAFEVTVDGDLTPNDYQFTLEAEDQAGNVTVFDGQQILVIDPYEFNNTNATASQLGSPETVTLNNVTHHGNAAPNPVGNDIDVYALYSAQHR